MKKTLSLLIMLLTLQQLSLSQDQHLVDSLQTALKTAGQDTNWGALDYDGVFLTRNSGTSWLKQNSAGPGAMWLFGIDYYNGERAIIVAESSSSKTGKILTTSNGGDLWELTYNASSWIKKVSFIKD